MLSLSLLKQWFQTIICLYRWFPEPCYLLNLYLCRLWDLRSGKIVQTLETKLPVTSAEMSQDGRYITTADGSTVKFWDANQ